MKSATFDYRLRTLGCPSCGAPLVAPREGGQVRCQYCSTTSVVSAREMAPRAGVRSSLADETARLSRLKAQLEHPVAGHAYDLRRPPLGFEKWVARNADDVERLFGEWSKAVQVPLGSHIEEQRRVCWMALQLASSPSVTDPLRIRTLLETTIGWLDDEGYRHLVRCRLARAALEEGDLDAADGWIKECDLAPEVLELDSASRLIRAWLAHLRHRADNVLELLGDAGTLLPIATHQHDEAQRLRVDAFEAMNRPAQALRGFQELAQKNGLDVETQHFTRHNLALETVRRAQCVRLAEVVQIRQTRLRKKIDELAQQREELTARSATVPMRRLPLIAAVLSIAVWLVQCSYDVDPLGGSYGYVLCPKVCAECRGPARTVTEWVETGAGERGTNGPQYFCQTPSNRVAELSAQELKLQLRNLSPHELGAFSAFAASYLVLLIALLPVGAIQSVRRALRNRPKYDALSAELQGLARQLGEPAPPAPAHLAGSLRASAIIVGAAGLLAMALAWWTA